MTLLEILCIVLVWLVACFIAGVIDTWLQQRKWDRYIHNPVTGNNYPVKPRSHHKVNSLWSNKNGN